MLLGQVFAWTLNNMLLSSCEFLKILAIDGRDWEATVKLRHSYGSSLKKIKNGKKEKKRNVAK